MQTAKLLYDGTCRFCTASARQALKIVPRQTLELLDINDPQVQAHYKVSAQAAQREMHLVDATGNISKGAAAARQLLLLSKWLKPLTWLWLVPGFGWVAQKVYLWISDHRYLLLGKTKQQAIQECEGGACAVHLGIKPDDLLRRDI